MLSTVYCEGLGDIVRIINYILIIIDLNKDQKPRVVENKIYLSDFNLLHVLMELALHFKVNNFQIVRIMCV